MKFETVDDKVKKELEDKILVCKLCKKIPRKQITHIRENHQKEWNSLSTIIIDVLLSLNNKSKYDSYREYNLKAHKTILEFYDIYPANLIDVIYCKTCNDVIFDDHLIEEHSKHDLYISKEDSL